VSRRQESDLVAIAAATDTAARHQFTPHTGQVHMRALFRVIESMLNCTVHQLSCLIHTATVAAAAIAAAVADTMTIVTATAIATVTDVANDREGMMLCLCCEIYSSK
jgi:hypothetical protein